MMGSFTGKRILVTGASSGIGRAAAKYLADRGADLVLVARDRLRLEQLHQELPSGLHSVAAYDVRQFQTLAGWMKEIATHGPLHGVVHSAGVSILRPLAALDSDSVATVFETNTFAALALAKGFRQKQVVATEGGAIVYVSSVAGLTGQAGISAYCGSKAALHAIAKSLSLELARQRIRVNCVAPGIVRTEMLGNLKKSLTAEQFKAIEDMHPLGIGEPDDVAAVIAFLLSDAARWITGTTVTVDGGYTAH
jgi:NAD(P)-dependent dehydrogenase (short-subunit alcohol dehydrogenase family)